VKEALKRYHNTIEIVDTQTFLATATSTTLLFHVHQIGWEIDTKTPYTRDESMPAFAAPDVADRTLGWNSESTSLLTNALM
jgi:hypothetical protein